jgi:signal transduction histidine kinase
VRGRFDSLGTLAVIGIIVLIGCVGHLQYQWISRASDADAERLSTQINRTADRIGTDFERELVTIWRLFHVPPINASQLEAELKTRRDEATLLNPGIIRRIVVIERGQLEAGDTAGKDAGVPGRHAMDQLEAGETAGKDAGVPARGASLRRLEADGRLVAAQPEGRFESAVMRLVTEPLDSVEPPRLPPEPFMTLIPLPIGAPVDAAASRRATRFVVITLDAKHLERKVLPKIVTEAVGDEPLAIRVERSDGSVVFSSDGKSFAASDADAVRTMLAMREPLPRTRMRQPSPPTPEERAKIEAAMQGGGQLRPGSWRLLLRHTSGSVGEAVGRVRTHNLLVSGALLLLLIVSLLLVLAGARRAQRLATQQFEFVTAITHELYTPLAAIQSAGQNLADGVVAQEQQVRRYGSMIVSEGRRLSQLVANALAFAGVGSGPRVRTDIALDDLVKRAAEEIAPLVDSRSMTLTVDAAPVVVYGDAESLRRAIDNLLSNGVKYGREHLRARVWSDDARACVAVEDDGRGVSVDEVKLLSKPFFRGAEARAEQVRGSGLGLAIVQRVVSEHRGSLLIEPRSEGGSRFTIVLPVRKR